MHILAAPDANQVDTEGSAIDDYIQFLQNLENEEADERERRMKHAFANVNVDDRLNLHLAAHKLHLYLPKIDEAPEDDDSAPTSAPTSTPATEPKPERSPSDVLSEPNADDTEIEEKFMGDAATFVDEPETNELHLAQNASNIANREADDRIGGFRLAENWRCTVRLNQDEKPEYISSECEEDKQTDRSLKNIDEIKTIAKPPTNKDPSREEEECQNASTSAAHEPHRTEPTTQKISSRYDDSDDDIYTIFSKIDEEPEDYDAVRTPTKNWRCYCTIRPILAVEPQHLNDNEIQQTARPFASRFNKPDVNKPLKNIEETETIAKRDTNKEPSRKQEEHQDASTSTAHEPHKKKPTTEQKPSNNIATEIEDDSDDDMYNILRGIVTSVDKLFDKRF